MSDPHKEIVDRSEFIAAMRKVASSVAVVTTDGPSGCHGATVSAFCSVSADPPTMLVCLNASSKMATMVAENEAFNINVLPESAKNTANRFAGADDAEIADRFMDVEHWVTTSGPALSGATVMTCKLEQVLRSGTHYIFTGIVKDIHQGAEQPLAYLDGAYHAVVPQSGICQEV